MIKVYEVPAGFLVIKNDEYITRWSRIENIYKPGFEKFTWDVCYQVPKSKPLCEATNLQELKSVLKKIFPEIF